MSTENNRDENDIEDDVNNGLEPLEEESRLAGEIDQDDKGEAEAGHADDADGSETEKDANADASGAQDGGDDGADTAGDDSSGKPDAGDEDQDQGKPAGDDADAADETRTARAAEPEPTAPKDFDAEFKSLAEKYDNGDLDTFEYQQQLRELNREESRYVARHEAWESAQSEQAAEAQSNFEAEAKQWESKNQHFMANPIRAQAMQNAIALIDQQTNGTLTPAALIRRAEETAFEALNYQQPGAGQSPAPARKHEDSRKITEAVSKRQDKSEKTPDLERAPAAADVDSRGNATYSQLDNADISDLEDAMANMSESERERYLSSSPGSDIRGQ